MSKEEKAKEYGKINLEIYPQISLVQTSEKPTNQATPPPSNTFPLN